MRHPDVNPSTPIADRAAVTALLARSQQGDARATNELFPIVYDELRSIASRYLRDESKASTLQATALVHEAYVRLVGPDADAPAWDNRAHFFGAAARAIRRILTDHARERLRLKRGGGAARVDLTDAVVQVVSDAEPIAPITSVSGVDILRLDDALIRLAELDEQKARVVELRFFAGLTVEQAAKALATSPSTVARDWQFSRAWLHRELSHER